MSINHHNTRWTGLLASVGSLLALLQIGCVVEGDPAQPATPPSTLTGVAKIFEDKAYPALANCKTCHVDGKNGAPQFLTNDAASSYSLIKGKATLYQHPDNSVLLSKGEHAGPALSAEQSAAVQEWLAAEFPGGPAQPPVGEDPDPGDPPPPTGDVTVEEAFIEAGKCMTESDWLIQEMDLLPFAQTFDSGPCMGCHSTGNGGTFLSGDESATFEANRIQPYIGKLFQPRYQDGRFVGLEKSRRFLDKGGIPCPEIDLGDFDVCHPEFTLAADQIQDLEAFQGSVLNKLVDGRCEF